METSKFYNFYKNITYGFSTYNLLLDKSNTCTDIEKEYIIPFRKELHKNFVDNNVNNIDLIKFYISELRQLDYLFRNADQKLLFEEPFTNNTLSERENNIVFSHYMFDSLFEQIQYCCLSYDVDFYFICNEVDFELDLICSGFSLVYENKRHVTPQKEKSKHENIFSNNGFMLFKYILSEYIKPKGKLGRYNDLSYFYRVLFTDKYIHQKSEPFRVWFIETYYDEFTKIMTQTSIETPQRKKDYSTALDWFKTQNK